MARNPEEIPKTVRLADGILLSIGSMANHLVNLATNEETPVDYRYVEAIERNAMGGNGEGLEEILDVSGMPRMEALRHLSRIHAKGFLRVS